MILKFVATLSKEIDSFDDPILVEIMKDMKMSKEDCHCIVHGKVTDVYQIIERG